MIGSAVAWVVAAAAGVAAALFLQRFRAEAARAGALEAELSAAREEIASGRAREHQSVEAYRSRSQEIVELRKRVDKLKKRVGQSRTEQDDEGQQLGRVQTELLEERALQRGLKKELDTARSELVAASEKLSAVEARLKALESERAARPLADDASIEKLEALRADAERARASAKKAAQLADKAKQDELRHKKRADNLDKVYMVLRAEHELVRDELRSQTAKLERLSALKAVMLDSASEDVSNGLPDAPVSGIRPATSPADALKTS